MIHPVRRRPRFAFTSVLFLPGGFSAENNVYLLPDGSGKVDVRAIYTTSLSEMIVQADSRQSASSRSLRAIEDARLAERMSSVHAAGSASYGPGAICQPAGVAAAPPIPITQTSEMTAH